MIKTGDVVEVVRLPSCGCDAAMGNIFRVTGFNDMQTPVCAHCGAQRARSVAAFGDNSGCAIEVYRLKRFPLPEELGLIQEKEEVTV